MAWVLRIRSSPIDVELLTSVLWDFRPHGVAQAESGGGIELLAGFALESDAAAALDALTSLENLAVANSGSDDHRVVVEVEFHEPSWAGPASTVISLDGPVLGPRLMRIESGRAFGHGGHPTTALALDALAELITPGCRVLDVGTGTGVLAIGAALLGAGAVLAIDNDPDAVGVAEANVTANQVDVRVSDSPISSIEGTFDLVVANLLVADIAPIFAEIERRRSPEGALVISGCLVEQQTWIESMFGPARTVTERDGWLAFVFR